tara:strand:+ start:307 stop:963 length:657 start_codon:yes stop_codon:yes gene_type:complete
MKVIILDLDDTLYNYLEFVKQGFKNVANFIEKETKISKNKIYKDLINIYFKQNTNRVFNTLKKKYKIKININKCILIYRYSERKIKPYKDAIHFLKKYKKKIYLVTDGNKIVQENKIKFLKLRKFFKKIYKTNHYGLKYNKPSLHCFNLIKEMENCNFNELIYIGDNPYKDFKNLNAVRGITIRLQKGIFKNTKVRKNYDAKYKSNNLYEVDKIINKL